MMFKSLLLAIVLFPVVTYAASPPSGADSISPNWLRAMSKAEEVTIPGACDAPRTVVDMQGQIPAVLKLPEGSATISSITDIHDFIVTNRKIVCQAIFQWSNGLVEKGQFSEWLNDYDATMVGYV